MSWRNLDFQGVTSKVQVEGYPRGCFIWHLKTLQSANQKPSDEGENKTFVPLW